MTATKSEATHASQWRLQFGARPLPDGGTEFRVWAPLAKSLAVRVVGDEVRTAEMVRTDGDTFEARVRGVGAGADYFYVLDGERERPDPVSRFQPAGVHGPSRVVDPEEFSWTDSGWKGIALGDLII